MPPTATGGSALVIASSTAMGSLTLSNSAQSVRLHVQVKSRYATDCDRGFPLKEKSLDAFDFLIVVFLNIGDFYRGRDGSARTRKAEFYTLPNLLIRKHHDKSSSWEKVRLRGLEKKIAPYLNEDGFEQIAIALGIPKPRKVIK